MYAIVHKRNQPSYAFVHRLETKQLRFVIARSTPDLSSEKAAVSFHFINPIA
jgi:hypothetical protein